MDIKIEDLLVISPSISTANINPHLFIPHSLIHRIVQKTHPHTCYAGYTRMQADWNPLFLANHLTVTKSHIKTCFSHVTGYICCCNSNNNKVIAIVETGDDLKSWYQVSHSLLKSEKRESERKKRIEEKTWNMTGESTSCYRGTGGNDASLCISFFWLLIFKSPHYDTLVCKRARDLENNRWKNKTLTSHREIGSSWTFRR